MIPTWGPAADAELTYRRDRLREDLAQARRARTGAPRRRDRGHAPARSPGRRWRLPLSAVWHVAP